MERLAQQQPSPRKLSLDECQQVSGGLIGPDQDLSDFPVFLWPRIRVAFDAQQMQAIATMVVG